MIKKILVALDGSRRSQLALSWARTLAPGARLALLRVIEAADPLSMRADYVSDLKLAAEKKLRQLGGGIVPPPEVAVAHGRPVAEILEAARRFGADAVALTTHGGAPFERRVFGRTTERLLHTADLPLLVVPAWEETPPPPRIHSVAVPLDGSEASERILPLARAVALEHRARVVLIHALEELDRAERAFADLHGHVKRTPLVEEMQASLEARRVEIQTRFNALAARLGSEGVEAKYACVRGSAPEILMTTAENESADLVVMAGHGQGAVRRALLGSVASRLIQLSSMPVLVARYDALQKNG
jgi:nucleotide-binding universal stress UspA family protein